jgi:hypothetical protein
LWVRLALIESDLDHREPQVRAAAPADFRIGARAEQKKLIKFATGTGGDRDHDVLTK